MTPMPPEIPRTMAAYRMITGKLQVFVQQRGMRLPALAALTCASLPAEKITVREAKRKALIYGQNIYKTVDALHKAGLVRCYGGDKAVGRLAVELTDAGIAFGEALRVALGGEAAKAEDGE